MALSLNIHKLTDAYLNGEEAAEEARRGGRMPMVGLKSNLGRVLDLSHCGVLIHRGGLFRGLRINQRVVVVLKFSDVKVAVKARVARKEKKRGIGRVYGLEFLNITDKQRQQICHIGQSCFPKQTLPGKEAAA